jgi:Ribonuclease G/E
MAAMSRTAFVDDAVGETRGVVLLDGRPERLLIERAGEGQAQAGAAFVARVARLDASLATAFLELPDGVSAITPAVAGLVEGASVEVEIAAPARRGKGPTARLIGPTAGAPRLIAPAPSIREQLKALAPGAAVIVGPDARAAADEAQDAALSIVHALPGGGSIAIETTRALTAIDVDIGARAGSDAKRAARQTNLAAIAAAARLLRLKALGGLVVFDLVGKGHDGEAMRSAARAAFADDGPEASFGAISRFGLFEMSLPRTAEPTSERLLDGQGALSAATVALALMRALEQAGRAEPGARLIALCAPDVADCAEALSPALVGRLGPRVFIEADPARSRPDFDVRAL